MTHCTNHVATIRKLAHASSASLICIALSFTIFLPDIAHAEDIDTNPTADAFQQQIEETAAAYNKAVEEAAATTAAIESNRERIAELEREIPKQQKRSEAATRELYKLQQQRVGIVELLLGADSFFDFLSNLEYIDRITADHLEEIELLSSMKTELNSKQAELEQAKKTADARAEEAKQALAAAQQARVEAQQRARGGMLQTTGTDLAPAARSGQTFSAAPSDTAMTNGSEKSDAVPATVANPEPEPLSEPENVDDGADWLSDEDVFVSEWAGRIDEYLAGSPLAGQGATFARAAWNYGVDPRWSPAISCTESSKGLYCFLPYNAWGWGSVSWGSWEEAIDAHVRGLARGYGYTISWDAACKYCPPNAEHWYNFTLSQMNMI